MHVFGALSAELIFEQSYPERDWTTIFRKMIAADLFVFRKKKLIFVMCCGSDFFE